MKQLLITLTITMMTTLIGKAQQTDFIKVKNMELQLEDVMEIIDTAMLKTKLKEVEESNKANPSELNKVRLGIVYH